MDAETARLQLAHGCEPVEPLAHGGGGRTRLKVLAILLAAAALSASTPAWNVRARLLADGHDLAVEGRFAPGDADAFMVDPADAPFVSEVETETAGKWDAVAEAGGRWPVAGAEARGAHLRWRFDLAAASKARRSGVRPFGSGFIFR
ncbi:MAG TPA: hypothetical protein VNV60_11945, partial [Holophagaceae bacterium]|nr:hypothetical protein [Holophagaceae bacterium]